MQRVKPIVAALLLAGCVSGGAEPESLGLMLATECGPEEYPEVLPTADALIDRPAFEADLRELADSSATEAGHVTLSMGYQTDGMNMRRELLEHSVAPFVADSVQKLVFAHRLTLPEASQEWGVRLRIDLGDSIAYGVERREYCPPRPRDSDVETAMRSYMSTGVRYTGGMRIRTIVVRLEIHPSGYVNTGRVVRGGHTGSTLEQEVVTYLRQFSFEPAKIDGTPTYGYVDIPVAVRG